MQIGRNDFNTKIVEFFFHRTRLVLLFLAAIVIGGVYSLTALEREGFPQVQPKIVAVNTVFPGASATEIETQITRPIENALKDTENLVDISSTSQANFSTVIINLKQKADLDISLQEIKSKLSAVESELPADAESPKVRTASFGGSDFILALTSRKPLNELKTKVSQITAELSRVSGIKNVTEMVPSAERVVISYNPEALAANKLTVAQIEQVLKASNLDFPLATLDIDQKQQSVVTSGAYSALTDIANQIVGISPTGNPLKLSDVAQIKQQLNETKKFERVGIIDKKKLVAKDAVLLALTVSEDNDILKVKANLDKKISDLKDEEVIPVDSDIEFIFDQSVATTRQLDEVIAGAIGDKNTLYLLGGIQLVLLSMLLFVNWRAAVVAALAIPISFLFTLLWLFLAGINLNTLVLFSLVLVLGLIVDPAIVILESIQRYKDLGRSGEEAVKETARRYGAGLFIAVLTSIIVFIPFGVVSGIFGELIKYIPLTVIPALFASYLVPMAFLPFIASRFLKSHKKAGKKLAEEDEVWAAAKVMMRFNGWVLKSFYRKILVLVVISFFIFFSLRLVVQGAIPVVQFSTPEDNDALQVTLTFPRGKTFDQKDALAQKVEEKLRLENGIENYFYFTQGSDDAVLFVQLKEKRTAEDKSKKILSRLREEFTQINGVEISVSESGVGPPESEYPIQVQLYDNDLVNLEKAAKEVGRYLASVKGVEKVDDGFTGKGDPKLAIVFDRNKLAAFGLTVFEASQNLKSRLAESQTTKFTQKSNDISFEINVSPNPDDLPQTKKAIEQLTVQNRLGQSLPLSSLAKIEETQTVEKIERFNSSRFVNVRAKITSADDLQHVQSELDKYLTDEKISDLGLDSRANKGENEDIAKSFTELFIALFAAIFLTYVVLVLQFNSFSQPLIMLFTIPLALIGVFPALILVKSQLGFLEILGLTILVGIVENVGIFLIDYANQLVKEKGMSLKEAIVLSSGIRFRPIILTKLVALGGLLPLAIFSPFWRGLSSVIIGGILVSGFLSMTVVPIFYTWFGAIRQRVHRRTP